MRINVYTYTIYTIVTTIDTLVTLLFFCFFSAVLSLDIKTILLDIERRTYNNINVAIETCCVHL